MSGNINFCFLMRCFTAKKKNIGSRCNSFNCTQNKSIWNLQCGVQKTNEELNMRGNDPCSAFLKLSSARKVINSCLRCPNNFSREVTLYHTQLNFCHIKQHEHRVVGCIHIWHRIQRIVGKWDKFLKRIV